MVEETVLSKSQIQAFESPTRLRIIIALRHRKALSAKEIAEEIGIPADRSYYHLRKLLDLALIEEKEFRATETKPEAVYQLTATIFHMTNLTGDPGYYESMVKSADRVLGMALRQYRENEGYNSDLSHFSFATGRCNEARMRSIRERLIEIGKEILESDDPDGKPVILAGLFTQSSK